MTTNPLPTERDATSKATLFCPDCDHRSRYDGDWTVVETAHDLSYRCPNCRTEITVRRSFESDLGRRCGPGFPRRTLTAWRDGVETWGRLWWRAVLPA